MSADGDRLADTLAAVRACRICLDDPSGRPLPHPPRPVLRARATATIGIFGQAPGTRVHASGVSFLDPSGDRLRAWMGIGPDTFYDERQIAILPMGFCFPGLDAKGADRPPRRECAPAWRARLIGLLPRIELVLLIGAYAQRFHLGARWRGSVAATVAAWREIAAEPLATPPCGATAIPLPHPSWRNQGWLAARPWFAEEVVPALQSAIGSRISTTAPTDPDQAATE